MRIGEYETRDILGKGATCEVYDAEHVRIGSRHALKLYTRTDEKDIKDIRKRFEAEGRLLACIDHPHIVKVTDYGTDAATGRPYFVMTRIADAEGRCRSLADIPSTEMDEETIGRWYDDIRDALSFIHAKGIIHRDLKLQNILLGPDGHVVLTDFGISHVFSTTNENALTNPVDTILRVKDGKNLLMGSIGYMAPEMEMGVEATPASDWYALGVILYKLLTGTWCDTRTDFKTTLETYDPVWMRIVPQLLHSNPAGRSCPGYAEEKKALHEQEEFELDNLRRFKRHRRMVRRWSALATVFVILLISCAGIWHYGGLALELQRLRKADFENLFALPETITQSAHARAYQAARDDACVLVQPLLADYRAKRINAPTLRAQFARMAHKLHTGNKTFYKEDHPSFQLTSESAALEDILKIAAERLRTNP